MRFFQLCFLCVFQTVLAAPARNLPNGMLQPWDRSCNGSDGKLFPTSAAGSNVPWPTGHSTTSSAALVTHSLAGPTAISSEAEDSDTTHFSQTTTFHFTSNALPTGLVIDTGLISGGSPDLLDHEFEEKNVVVTNGYLKLTVPGGQTGDVISSAEVATDFDVLYGSVRTYAVLTETAGVFNGISFTNLDFTQMSLAEI